MNKKLIVLPLFTAVLYVLATPPVDLALLGWFCLVPLLFALTKCNSYKEVFLTGIISGLTSTVATYYWLVHTMTTFGGLSYLLSVFLFILLAGYLSLYWSLFTLTIRFLSARKLPFILIAPFVWVSLEYLRTYLFSGFPWALLGYTQYKMPYLIQVSDLLGAYGISFILVLSSAIICKGICVYLSGKVIPTKEIIMLLLLLLINISYGFINIHKYVEPSNYIVSALIQGNIEQNMKWNKNHQDETINIYGDLSKSAAENSNELDLIIWPETAAPFYFQNKSRLRKKTIDISESLNVPILFGSPAYKYEDKKARLLNSAFLIAPQPGGGVSTLARYDKVHLVPFGEYVPLKKILFFVNKITEGIGDFSAGENTTPLTIKINKKNSTVALLGTNICYEGIFPDLIRRFVKNGANILVNITNDAWYGRSSAPYQHLSAAVFRAVENGIYMLRAANTGVTAVINPLGQIEKSTDIFTRDYITAKVTLREKMTFYTKNGDVFAIFVSISTVVAIIYILIINIKRRSCNRL